MCGTGLRRERRALELELASANGALAQARVLESPLSLSCLIWQSSRPLSCLIWQARVLEGSLSALAPNATPAALEATLREQLAQV